MTADCIHRQDITKPNGITYRVEVFHDYDYGPPDKESDCHGVIVTQEELGYDPDDDDSFNEWLHEEGYDEDDFVDITLQMLRRSLLEKMPDQYRYTGRETQYYDVFESRKLAAAQGWGVSTEWKQANPNTTREEEIAEAVRSDYQYLYGWYNYDWHYITVKVSRIDPETGEPDDDLAHYSGGYDSTMVTQDRPYFMEVINDGIAQVEYDHRQYANPKQMELPL